MKKLLVLLCLVASAAVFSNAPVAAADRAALTAPDLAVCVDRDLRRPDFFGGPNRTKRTPTGRVGVSGSNIGRSFGWSGKSFLWTGSYEWYFSYRFRGDNECARSYKRAAWYKVVFFVSPRVRGQKRRWDTGWSSNIFSTLSEDYWGTDPQYGLWTGTRSRSMPGQRIGKVRRAAATVKIQLIRKSDNRIVATRYHKTGLNLIDDFCSGPRGYAGGAVRGRPSCAAKYPGYDSGGKTPR